ncbi:MAG: GNAT family N-acetyltransferase [Micropepsaceae bacterium]
MTHARYRLHDFDHAHLPELADLWIAAWNRAMPSIDFETRRVWLVDRLVALHDGGVAVICVFDSTNGDMAGFITLDAKTGHIDQLAVAPNHWGSSAAAQLMAEAKTRASGRLTLDVNQDNHRAIRFYEKQGFRRAAAGTNPASGLDTWTYTWQRR